MSDTQSSQQPDSAEARTDQLQQELDQQNISKDGPARDADDAGETQSSHMGAVEDDVTGKSDMEPVIPPMEGPSEVTHGADDQGADVDPQDEIMGG